MGEEDSIVSFSFFLRAKKLTAKQLKSQDLR